MVEFAPYIYDAGDNQLFDLSKVYRIGNILYGDSKFYLQVWVMGDNQAHQLPLPLLEEEFEPIEMAGGNKKQYPLIKDVIPSDLYDDWKLDEPRIYVCYERLCGLRNEIISLWKQTYCTLKPTA